MDKNSIEDHLEYFCRILCGDGFSEDHCCTNDTGFLKETHNDINTLGIEDLCDRAIDMLKSRDTTYSTTYDVVNILELIKSRAKLLRE